MKLYFKLAYMCFLGIATAVIWYPFLHESGHYIAMVLLGGTDVNMQFFPSTFVSGGMVNPAKWHYAIIGLSGLFLPMTAFALRPKSFTVWFINEIVKCIVVFSWFLSVIAVVCMICGNEWRNDDIVTVVRTGGGSEATWLVICTTIAVVSAILLIKDRPWNKLESFF